MRIGFIGLGRMGGPMAANLQKAGHALTVHDLDRAAAAPHLERGAAWADTPKAVAEASEIVLTSLPGPVEVEAVATGPAGIFEGVAAGSVYVDTSTNSPTVIRRIAERIEAAGAHMVDAPVSGGPIGAEAGTLAVMVGGDEAVFRRVRPVLEALGPGISYIGEVGSGTVAKLVHNAISMTTRIAVQEGMALAVKAGVEPAKMLDVSLALELAKDVGAPLALAAMAVEEIQRGIVRGWADRDNLVTYLLAEERAGVQIRESK